MRDAMEHLDGNAKKINPLVPVDLVIDHSVAVNYFGHADSFKKNVEDEYKQNQERYRFLKWAQQSFENFRVVPPGTGICHQVNLEYLSQTVWLGKGTAKIDGKEVTGDIAYPDTVVGTDSHTTMVNGLSVLGWGVGGIEAEAAMLGQPYSMVLPEVIGVKLTGKLKEGMTATDLVLTVTQMLRKRGVVGKFVEFFGPGLGGLTIADRATIGNMAPEYGATCGFFPIDEDTIGYLTDTNRAQARIDLVEAYAKAQGMFRTKTTLDPIFTDVLKLELASIEPSLAGPKRPQDRIEIGNVKKTFTALYSKPTSENGFNQPAAKLGETFTTSAGTKVKNGDILIAAITSCTNTSNPSVLLAAGLLAKKAVEAGLTVPKHIKTSLAPGSRVVTNYLTKTGLLPYLDKLGFDVAAYGCTTCIGNAGDLTPDLNEAITSNDLVCAAVLSGNRNFEARIHPNIKANFLASPPLVVAYAIAGTVLKDLMTEPVGRAKKGDVWLGDIWPTTKEIDDLLKFAMDPDAFRDNYGQVKTKPGKLWENIKGVKGETYDWPKSTYIAEPPFFEGFSMTPGAMPTVKGARALGIFGDSVTTDHISPAGSIKTTSPAGKWLEEHGVHKADFNSYGSRRGNHEIMMRGTFANVRIKNLMIPPMADGSRFEGGDTLFQPGGEQMSIYDAAMKYIAQGTSSVVFGGEEYGTGSSRDWAAKGTQLLGVKAVIARSFERIHRNNLVGMGVLPLQFKGNDSVDSLNITGEETFDISGLEQGIKPMQHVTLTIHRPDGSKQDVTLLLRIDTPIEVDYYKHGGILPFVLRQLLAA